MRQQEVDAAYSSLDEVVAEISDPGAGVQHEHRAVVERELDA